MITLLRGAAYYKGRDATLSDYMDRIQTLLRASNVGTQEEPHLPNSSIQHHSDRDIEVAEGFGHFLTEGDMKK